MTMEKRWTRKKRAARDAGGPEPKPALSGPIRLSEPAVAPTEPAPKRPARRAREIDPALLELEADPVTAEPEPKPPETPAPKAETPEAAEAPAPEPEPSPPVTPTRPITYRVKRVRRPGPVDPVEAAPEPPAPLVAPQDDAPAPVADVAPAERQETAAVEMPPEPLAMPDLPPAEPDPVESVVEPVAAAPEPSAPAPEPVAAEPEPVAPVAEPVVAQANPATPEVVEPEVEAPDPWTRIRKFPIDARKLERNRIVTATREDPVHSSFDVLRTKLLKALRDNGWSRVAVTSPTEGCGKTFMAANLALSLSRQGNCRTVVLDLDMRHPALAKTMNVANSPAIADFLSGQMPAEDFLRRPGRNPHKIGDNVAFGFNTRREEFAAELLQDGMTARTLDAMEAALKPDVVLLDMPPALVNDDVLAARPLYDGIILVVGGGMTRPQQVRDVERRLGTDTPLLGVVLNKSEDDTSQNYGY